MAKLMDLSHSWLYICCEYFCQSFMLINIWTLPYSILHSLNVVIVA